MAACVVPEAMSARINSRVAGGVGRPGLWRWGGWVSGIARAAFPVGAGVMRRRVALGRARVKRGGCRGVVGGGEFSRGRAALAPARLRGGLGLSGSPPARRVVAGRLLRLSPARGPCLWGLVAARAGGRAWEGGGRRRSRLLRPRARWAGVGGRVGLLGVGRRGVVAARLFGELVLCLGSGWVFMGGAGLDKRPRRAFPVKKFR